VALGSDCSYQLIKTMHEQRRGDDGDYATTVHVQGGGYKSDISMEAPFGFQTPIAQIDRDNGNYAVVVILTSHHDSYHYSTEMMHTWSGGYDGDVSAAVPASFCLGNTDHSTEVMHAEIRGQHGNNATAGQLALS